MRFDFTHFSAMTADELAEVEAIVNKEILTGIEVDTREMPIDEAKKLGAMALFGEKYGKIVRVVRMGDFSTEFCGGTHVDNTARIGLFKIISETSVAAGVRRIEAVTGLGILALIAEKESLINSTAAELKSANASEIAKRAAQLQGELRAAKREIDSLNSGIAASKIGEIVNNAVDVKGVKLATAEFDGMQLDVARSLADEIKANHSNTVAILAITSEGKLNFIAVAGKDAVAAGVHAGKLVGAVSAVTGGKGGGRPDSAMAGGRDASKTAEALSIAADTVSGMIK